MSSTSRVLVLGDANSPHTVRWVNSLAASGCETRLFALHDRVASSTALNPSVTTVSAGMSVATAQRGAGAAAKLRYLTAVRRLRHEARSFRPHVVHAHFASSYGLLACAIPGRRRRVISVWGSDVFAFPDRSRLHRFVLRSVLGRAERLYSSSETMAERCRELTDARVVVIPFGVDTERFRPTIRPDDGPLVVGTVKSLEATYGIDVLIEAFAAVRRRLEPTDVRLRIVGDGTRREELAELVGKYGLEAAVEWVGRVPQDDVQDQLHRMDIFANLSYWESFGVSVLEASATGLPVVCTDVGGLREVVRDEVTGLLVPPGDASAAADAIVELCLHAGRRRSLGARGRELVEARYEWSECVSAQLAEYEDLRRQKT